MQRKRGGSVPIGEVVSGLDEGPVPAIRNASPQARLLALCSLPRTNPGNRKEYKRVNGHYTLYMAAGGGCKLPYGSLPRLLMAWISTEAVRTQSRELALGRSLSAFMRSLGLEPVGGVRTRLRNQMKRLFNAHVRLVYEDKHGEQFVNSLIAERGEFWWNPKRPDERTLWESKIELSEKFFNEIINHPVPLDMNTLKALKRSPLGLDLYLWLWSTAPSRYGSLGDTSTSSSGRTRPTPAIRT